MWIKSDEIIGSCSECYAITELWRVSPVRGECCVHCALQYLRYWRDNAVNEEKPDSEIAEMNTDLDFNPLNSPDIFGERMETCYSCNSVFTDEDNPKIEVKHDDTIVGIHLECSIKCNHCNNSYIRRRWRRNSRHPNVDYTTFHQVRNFNTPICEPCFDTYREDNFIDFCDCCETWCSSNEFEEYRGTSYCDLCISANVYECRDCGNEYWDGDGHDCSDDNSIIHGYDYKPSPYFFPENGHPYYFGIELEVESTGRDVDTVAEGVQEILGHHAYIKHDGSLSNGFEIVTHPHTLKAYKDMSWDWISYLKRNRFVSWNASSCGLHVHVSRTAFGTRHPKPRQYVLSKQAHELRFMKLIYDNQGAVERLAGRRSNSYSSFNDKGNLVAKVKHNHQSNGRYSVVNTENDTTIEVRIFKGSINQARIMSAIEFVQACVEYTRNLKITSKNNALSWTAFIGYVAQNSETYPNLLVKLNESFQREPMTSEDE